MELREATEREEEAFALFSDKYQLQHPPPVERSVGGVAGWQFYLLVLTSVAAVILAALRTADQFYRAALLSGNQFLAYAEAVAVLFAIEGGIVVYSAIRASSNKSISRNRLGWGIFLMVLISTFAGLGQSLNLIEGIDPTFQKYFEYALSLVIGVGASAVAWIGGEVLGSQIALVGAKREEAQKAYERQEEEYRQALLRSWGTSAERKIARGELMSELDRSFDERTQRTNDVRRTRPNLPNEGQYIQRDRIAGYIQNVFDKEGRVPGPTEIASTVGASKGYASEILDDWRRNNSSSL